MFTSLLLISFLLIYLYLSKTIKEEKDFGSLFLKTTCLLGVMLVLSTEVLSFFQSVSFVPLVIFWTAIPIIFAFLSLKTTSQPSLKTRFLSLFQTLTKFEIFILLYLLTSCLILGIIAFLAPPNTFDSLTYHLSRVAHWAQNKSVLNYPTHCLRQLGYNPGAEYFILHTYILSHGDRFANFIQFFSMIGCLLGTSLIAKSLGAKRTGQIFTALITATIPMGILQSTSTQNDYVTAFWLICFIYHLFQLNKKFCLQNVFFVAASFGLGILTKGTFYIYSLPFVIWSLGLNIKTHKTKVIKYLFLFVSLTLIINISFYLRNYQLGKNILTPVEQSQKVKNEKISLGVLASNVLRNISLNTQTPFKRVNAFSFNTINSLHNIFGIDINDPRSTFGSKQFYIPELGRHEDHAGNPVHLVLGIICLFIFMFSKNLRKNSTLTLYCCLCSSAFILFCLLLKWQPWNSRLLLPLFIVFSPFIGVVLSNRKDQKISILFSLILIIFSLPVIFKNSSRPILSKDQTILNTPREKQYFSNNKGLASSYLQAANYLSQSNCADIGYLGGEDTWEYPLWALLKRSKNQFHMESVLIDNVSKKYENQKFYKTFEPCAVIDTNKRKDFKISLKNAPYVKAKIFDHINIFIKDTDGTLGEKLSKYHFLKTVELLQKTLSLLSSRNPLDNFKSKNFEIIRNIKQILDHAQLVNPTVLNNAFPALGDRFHNELLMGLELYAVGYLKRDFAKYQNGYSLMIKWQQFSLQNRKKIQ